MWYKLSPLLTCDKIRTLLFPDQEEDEPSEEPVNQNFWINPQKQEKVPLSSPSFISAHTYLTFNYRMF